MLPSALLSVSCILFALILFGIFDPGQLSLGWTLLWRCNWSVPAALISRDALSPRRAVASLWREISLPIISYASLTEEQPVQQCRWIFWKSTNNKREKVLVLGVLEAWKHQISTGESGGGLTKLSLRDSAWKASMPADLGISTMVIFARTDW